MPNAAHLALVAHQSLSNGVDLGMKIRYMVLLVKGTYSGATNGMEDGQLSDTSRA